MHFLIKILTTTLSNRHVLCHTQVTIERLSNLFKVTCLIALEPDLRSRPVTPMSIVQFFQKILLFLETSILIVLHVYCLGVNKISSVFSHLLSGQLSKCIYRQLIEIACSCDSKHSYLLPCSQLYLISIMSVLQTNHSCRLSGCGFSLFYLHW